MQSDQPKKTLYRVADLNGVSNDIIIDNGSDIIDDSSLEDISDETLMKIHSIEEAKEKKVRKKYNEKDYEKIGTICSEYARIKIKKINGTYKIV